jgi:hypothetical protein
MRLAGTACGLFVFLLGAGRAEALEGYCTNGAVNTVTGNYVATDKVAGDEGLAQCEICLVVRVQEPGVAGGWEEVGRVCNIRSDAQAHDVMFRIDQCGLIVPQFEAPGLFYGSKVPIRIDAYRLPSCS